ncbi:hypothetical protein [Candidatus Endomicrobiellum agilis]|uniref:hypothetical protein n=1 Tax=Candidatus Endomicrobiellum agilis TaxID=3238957 RepID=UPI00357A0A7E|nr:hypothetical protein [Endomicrobium sp.]
MRKVISLLLSVILISGCDKQLNRSKSEVAKPDTQNAKQENLTPIPTPNPTPTPTSNLTTGIVTAEDNRSITARIVTAVISLAAFAVAAYTTKLGKNEICALDLNPTNLYVKALVLVLCLGSFSGFYWIS